MTAKGKTRLDVKYKMYISNDLRGKSVIKRVVYKISIWFFYILNILSLKAIGLLILLKIDTNSSIRFFLSIRRERKNLLKPSG